MLLMLAAGWEMFAREAETREAETREAGDTDAAHPRLRYSGNHSADQGLRYVLKP
jgi:hypothetical protein